jgi:formamidopyrimidine-DNA glycosylase
MPELPETETIARGLDRAVSGARITSVSVTRSDVLREVSPSTLKRRVSGADILRTVRRAKLVVIELSTSERIVVQPRFTGALIIDAGDLPDREREYSTVAFALADGRTLHYRDIRRLGTVMLMSRARWAEYEGALGPEPLDHSFTPALLSGLLRGSRQAVKKLLMDQRRLAGIGNIYATEALWRASIDPSRAGETITPAESQALHGAITGVLRESIAARGTSFRDYRDATGERGEFASQLAAYGRAGEPCKRCGVHLATTDAIDGRATVFCAHCQR